MITVLQGDVLDQLRCLGSDLVHCVVTSPPYWGLRDYQVDGQIGLEKTPELYIAKMVEVFREVRRVLRPDGTCWINIGDSYANDGKWGGETGGYQAYLPTADRARTGRSKRFTGLKAKDMVGIPWMLAFALRADGWYLRCDIIWAKPNPMPESVQDRPTKSHEYIFLLTKSADYFYDYVAVQEPSSGTAHARSAAAAEFPGSGERDEHRRRPGVNPKANGPNSRMVRERTPAGATNKPNPSASNVRSKQNPSFAEAVHRLVSTRNKRSVWTVASAPYKGAHYATFPPNLIKPCILAGTSAKGACALCGAPWVRLVEKLPVEKAEYNGKYSKDDHRGNNLQKALLTARAQGGDHDNPFPPPKTIGWAQGCQCISAPAPVPSVVLDPFAGSFVTCMVAMEFGRHSIGIELNPESCQLGRERCNITPGLALS